MCSKLNFIAIFLILANFAAFLDHTKENDDVSKDGGYSWVNFYIYRKYMPEAFSTPNLVALPVTSQELGRGGFFAPPPTKIVLSNSQTTIGLSSGGVSLVSQHATRQDFSRYFSGSEQWRQDGRYIRSGDIME